MSQAMASGQLYRVLVTAFSKENSEITKSDYLIIGLSIDDIRQKFQYVVDVSDFERYRIDSVIKEPGRAYLIKTKIVREDRLPEDATIMRDMGSQAVFQKSVSTDKKWSVMAITECYAKSEKIAAKKLAERIVGGSESIKLIIEEMFSGDGYAKGKDMSMFPQASFVRG